MLIIAVVVVVAIVFAVVASQLQRKVDPRPEAEAEQDIQGVGPDKGSGSADPNILG